MQPLSQPSPYALTCSLGALGAVGPSLPAFMTELEAEIQATANLSPVSPAPVHTAAPRMVPALQNTADTIDAMVSAATVSLAAPNSVVGANTGPAIAGDAPPVTGTDNVDNDSLDGAYNNDDNDSDNQTISVPRPQPELPDSSDDYAKTFDSPMDSEEGEPQQHVPLSSMHPKTHHIPLPSAGLNITTAPELTVHEPSTAQQAIFENPAALSGGLLVSSEEPSSLQQPLAQPEPAANPDSAYAESMDSSLDIQKLVADLTAQPTESTSDHGPPSPSAVAGAEQPAGSASLNSSISLPSSSLPPRPPQPPLGSPSYASQHHAAASNASLADSNATVPAVAVQSSDFIAGGTETVSSLPSLPAACSHAAPAAASLNDKSHASTQAASGELDADYQHQWEQFMADERQYMSDAKWDRFPEGSRIFIGNLSSDKVSKRDVFQVFHQYGRLAQISLKSAYGFVQYHTVDEGRQAMENLQGVEIKGRRIHLEISRAQDKSKKDGGGGRNDRRNRDGRRGGDKHHQGRDDYRPGRNHSPRRNDYHSRDDNFTRSRTYESSRGGGRGRSRSPEHNRNDRDSYRRRSPSPYGRSRHDTAGLELPRRYGSDVPDVQIILQPEVSREFVAWVEDAFKRKSLKTEVMYLHPRFPKDQVIQRQAAEGVYGVVDLDMRAQSLGRIPVQAFDRSAGGHNIRFDQYVDLDPATAAEVILRVKAAAAASYGQGYAAAVTGYSNPYVGQHQPQPYSNPYPPQPTQQQPHSNPAVPDFANFMGQVDNATLQRLLSSIQSTSSTPSGIPSSLSGYSASHSAPPAAASQVDIQAILGSLGGAAPVQQQQHEPLHGQYGAAYGSLPPMVPNGGTNTGPAGSDAAVQVQNIMAQLARYRQ